MAKKIMSMIKINSNELKAAVKKMKGFSNETFILTCSANRTADGEKFLAQFQASNGTAQAMVLVPYEADAASEETFMMGSEFAGVVDTLSAFGEVFELEKVGESLKVTCGTATLPLPIQKDAVSFGLDSFNDGAVRMVMKKKELLALITQGGFACSDSAERAFLYQTVHLLPEVDGEERKLRATSSNGYMIASAVAPCEVKSDDVFSSWAQEKSGVIVKVTALSALVRRIIEDEVFVYISKKQLMVRDGDDVYCFVCVNEFFPKQFTDMIVARGSIQYNFSVKKADLKAAVNVSGLLNKDGKVKLTRTEDEEFIVSNASGDSFAKVETDGEGMVETRLTILLLMKTLDALLTEEIRLSGSNDVAGVYFSSTSGTADVFLLPIQ